MDEPPSNPGNEATFSIAFTRAILLWNEVEGSAREMLIAMSGESIGTFAVVTHLGNTALPDALLAVAEYLDNSEIEDAIKHFVKCMNILRAYRNYYVHAATSIGTIITPSGPKFVGILETWSARGKIVGHADHVTVEQMFNLYERCMQLSFYGNMIRDHIIWHNRREKPPRELFPLQNRPPLPDALQKTPHKLQPLSDPPPT